MSAAFDPYHQWLAIPREEQPPHHYRLLGVKPLEDNLDVIENAADQKMLHLRTYQSGKHAELSQKILNEISAAKVLLLDPAKKSAYDAELRAKLNAAKQAELKKAREERPLAMAKPLPTAAPLDAKPAAAAPAKMAAPQFSAPTTRAKPRGSNSVVLLIAAGVVALVLLAVGGIAGMMLLADNEPVAAVTPRANTTPGDEAGASDNVAPVVPPVIPPQGDGDKPAVEPPAVVDNDPAPETPTEEPTTDDPTEPIDEAPIDEQPTDGEEGEEFVAVEDEPAAPEKLPVPEKEAREAKRKEILAIFPVAQARTFEEKGEYAAQLIRTAGETADDPTAVFAMLNLAREQAAEAGHIKLAFEATDLLAETFDFDGQAVRLASVQQASRATLPPAAKRDIVIAGMDVIDELSSADKFDDVDALSDRMLAIARPLRDAELTKNLADQRKAFAELAASYKKAQSAFETLKRSPDDAEANLAAGRYLTFVKQDWDAGLAHLAKGSDASLAAAAKAELAAPETAADQEKLADAWWAAAEAQKDPTTQKICRAQSGAWYRGIVDDFSGLAKVRVEKRIADAGDLSIAPRFAPARGKHEWEVVYLDDLPEAEVRIGQFEFKKHGNGYGGETRRRLFQGEPQAHSLGLHAKTRDFVGVSYQLDGTFERFEAVAALWDAMPESDSHFAVSPLTFSVIRDGRVVWKSEPLQAHGASQPCSVAIKGAKLLTLRVDCPGDMANGWSVWINPRISKPKLETNLAATEPDLGIFSRDPTELSSQLAPSVSDVWDTSRGVSVVKNSPMLDVGDYHGDVRDLFGGEFGHIPPREQAGSLLFSDADRDATHFVEWKTKSPVTIRRIALFAQSDGGGIDLRRASRMVLAAWDPRKKEFRVFYEVDLGKPYGKTIAPPRTVVDDSEIALRLEAEVPPTTAQLFRAEFVQADNSVNSRAGIRLLELDGFEQPRVALPSRVAVQSAQVVYLDDLTESEANVAHTLGKHGVDWTGGRTANFQGKVPAHSLATHPHADGMGFVSYNLDRKFDTFAASAGQWDYRGAMSKTPVTFRVAGDGKVLWESQPIQRHGGSEDCQVSVRGVRVLTLEAHCPGDASYALAVWGDPRVARTQPKSSE